MSGQEKCNIRVFSDMKGKRELAVERLLDSFSICSSVRDNYGAVVDFTIEYVNDAPCKFIDKDVKNYIGKSLLELFPRNKHNLAFHELTKVVDEDIPLTRKFFLYEEIEGIKKIKTAYDIRVVKLEDGIAATWRENTQRKKFEEVQKKNCIALANADDEYRQLTAIVESSEDAIIGNIIKLYEAQESDKLKTEFFTNISHELKTPLNIILSSLQLHELLSQNNKSEENGKKIKKLTKVMKQNCYRLLRMINNLIDTTRIDTGFYKLYLQNCNIVSVVEDVVMSAAEYVRNKGIDLQFDTEMEERIIACDPDKIERIILNLLSNAVKFNKQNGSILVRIFMDNAFVYISVRDNGIGIEEDKLGTIFERFRQVDKSLTRNCEGSGIGLSLVKALTEMHGGTIEVKSEYGLGSEFVIRLPSRIAKNDSHNLDYTQRSIVGDDVGNSETEKINIEFSDIYFHK